MLDSPKPQLVSRKETFLDRKPDVNSQARSFIDLAVRPDTAWDYFTARARLLALFCSPLLIVSRARESEAIQFHRTVLLQTTA